jgi:flagellar protein FlaI
MTDASTPGERGRGDERTPGDEDELRDRLVAACGHGGSLTGRLGAATVNVSADLDEDRFFADADGDPTLVSRYDLERAVPAAKKRHLREVERYWVNKPYAFVVLFRSEKENELKYYVVEPHLDAVETEVRAFLSEKLADAIKYSREAGERDESAADRAQVIEEETLSLLERYGLYGGIDDDGGSLLDTLRSLLADEGGGAGRDTTGTAGIYPATESVRGGDRDVRPEPAVVAESVDELATAQVEKLLYYLKRDFVGYGRIDPVKHDINVEDISCDGYETPVFAYHTDYEQLITNIDYEPAELDDFVVKLAQRSGKGISKRQPQVDATLPDGSRAQLTLGTAVSDHGTNFTIRQFKDVPFTPVDLVNWHTFSIEQMAFLWLCIENDKSLVFAGGTASGKTTSLNAVSLFIPSKAKIVSIEDTREVELPQRNWVASVTRPSFSEEGSGDIDEFDLLEAALRQRPDYIVMGEVRGEEGRTLFQVMSTGHTTYTTFHADSVGEVLKRFTTDPINVSKTMFTALDLVSIQTQTRTGGQKVRRNRTLTEIQRYDADNDEITVQDIYEWDAATDEFVQATSSQKLQEIAFDRGWDDERVQQELFERQVVLSYLVDRGLTTYAEVAATIQGYMHDADTILGLMAQDRLGESLADLRDMETVLVDVAEAKEAMVPRPDPTEATAEHAAATLERAAEHVFDAFEADPDRTVEAALPESDTAAAPDSAAATVPADAYDWNTEGGTAGLADVPERTGETTTPAGGADLRMQGSDGSDGNDGAAGEGSTGDGGGSVEAIETSPDDQRDGAVLPPGEGDHSDSDADSGAEADEQPTVADGARSPDEDAVPDSVTDAGDENAEEKH